jgi:hypothetical protein
VEALGEGEGTCVVARLDRARRELCAHPLAVLREDEALRTDNLFLDQPQRETLASALLQRLRSFVSRSLETESRTALPQLEEASSATDRRLRALERELLRLAERGVAGLSDSSHSLRALTSDLRSAGLDFPEVPREVRSLPETVLRLRYIMSVLQVLRG